ncbi:MAG: PhzF family phenazine biosynthesis protein [Deltaproteobacteria bacterium]|nr:PhzF family phenazine biosynthesis protein [Deltaproteobacteria bacterium]
MDSRRELPTPYALIDAFTAEPFRGNPAAVCWLDAPRSDDWRRSVAAEMNLSETAFIEPQADGFGLRWFTPTVEVPLCGHATLASAHLLYSTGRLGRDRPARFHTRSGLLTARMDGSRIVLDFPAFASQTASAPRALVEAVGVTPIETLRVDRPGTDPGWILVLEDEATVRRATPAFGAMRAAAPDSVVLTAPPTAESRALGVDFVSRYFAPGHGIDEDPVTGSAHCMLAPYWARRLGRDRMHAYQASARGGHLFLALRDGRVELAGDAVTLAEGRILV